MEVNCCFHNTICILQTGEDVKMLYHFNYYFTLGVHYSRENVFPKGLWGILETLVAPSHLWFKFQLACLPPSTPETLCPSTFTELIILYWTCLLTCL